jgi:16S rRNA (cytidine1402-2'-O)-methyltransferase
LHSETSTRAEPALYVVATPIGNLHDLTLRALDVLRAVDLVAAEDTRVTRHLLAHFTIDTQTTALHEHNEERAAERIIEMLRQGKSVALVSDAGTPAISDPGARLVRRAREAGLRVVPIPGPSALIAALSVSGVSDEHFLFYGFLPSRGAARLRELERVGQVPSAALVFYEAPHRVRETLADFEQAFGAERHVIIARELTKMFEAIHACRLGDACAWLDADPNRSRGEFVLIVEGAAANGDADAEEVERVLGLLLAQLPLKQAVQLAADITGAKKNALYQRALQLREE